MKINETVRLFNEMRGDSPALSVSTQHGTVEIARLEVGQIQGLYYVEVWLPGQEGDDPAYKIFNPPVYVVDNAEGEETEELRKEDSETYKTTAKLKYDPVMALMETVAQHGGVRA